MVAEFGLVSDPVSVRWCPPKRYAYRERERERGALAQLHIHIYVYICMTMFISISVSSTTFPVTVTFTSMFTSIYNGTIMHMCTYMYIYNK